MSIYSEPVAKTTMMMKQGRRRGGSFNNNNNVPLRQRRTHSTRMLVVVLLVVLFLVLQSIPMLVKTTTSTTFLLEPPFLFGGMSSSSSSAASAPSLSSMEDATISVDRYLGVTNNRKTRKRQRRREKQHSTNKPTTTTTVLLDFNDPAVCLSSECLDREARLIARAFPDKPKETWWVKSEDDDEHTVAQPGASLLPLGSGAASIQQRSKKKWQGILAVRPFKAASSTTAGIALRMANRTGGCAVRYQHYTGFHYFHRDPQHSLLMAPIRRPSSRAFSAAHYFRASAAGDGGGGSNDNSTTTIFQEEKSDDEMIQLFRQYIQRWKGGLFYNYLRGIAPSRNDFHEMQTSTSSNSSSGPARVHAILRDSILYQYDFLLVAERMDESAVVLALLTGLGDNDDDDDNNNNNGVGMGDVLVRPSKVAGADATQARYTRNSQGCFPYHYRKESMSPAVYNFTQSREWLYMNYADEVLYRAANYSLDLTIQRLGVDRFQRALKEYRSLQQQVQESCPEPPGCTPGDTRRVGEVTEEGCYREDFGCGWSCVDDLLLNKSMSVTRETRIR